MEIIDYYWKRRAQRDSGEKTLKFGHNEILGYVEFIGVSSTINP
jgi:hypothetical protein